MEEMGDDEVMALLVSLGIGIMGAFTWFARGLSTTSLGERGGRALMLFLPLLALGGLWMALGTGAAVDVRTDVRYQFLFVAMGSVWVFYGPRALSLIGVSYLDDALERRNGAARAAIIGTTLGLTILFTGSNMGEGPSIWNTVETAVCATGILCIAVLVLAAVTSVGDTIAIERDAAAGVRFAGWIAACGVILGRASAGDWAGEEAMIRDLVAIGWPVAVLLGVAILLEIALRPREASPRPNVLAAGIVPAGVQLAAALAYVSVVG